MQVLDYPARFLVGGMKISECKANNPTPQSSHAHMPGIWMGSLAQVRSGARGGGEDVGEHPITSLQQGRNGCEAGPAAAEVCWAGSGSGGRGSGFGVASLGPWKNPPLLPHATFIFWVGGTPCRSLPRPYPSRHRTPAHTIHARFSPAVSLSLPLSSAPFPSLSC